MERWEEYNEPISTISNTSLRAKVLLDHMSTTKDISDYLWYTVRLGSMHPVEMIHWHRTLGRWAREKFGYNVPRSFLKPRGNWLVVLEEEYGDPLGITLDGVSIS
ncbi:hypothetical protein V6N11_028367 [Hibiscus sabdariffa]|uniref:Uncharacterized protein n=1 Tax=Hibiscus sabdariffa TaxID=183260 RepID=A0ABR2NQC4_9ROSI